MAHLSFEVRDTFVKLLVAELPQRVRRWCICIGVRWQVHTQGLARHGGTSLHQNNRIPWAEVFTANLLQLGCSPCLHKPALQELITSFDPDLFDGRLAAFEVQMSIPGRAAFDPAPAAGPDGELITPLPCFCPDNVFLRRYLGQGS
jgi:hypothetical protein